MNDIFIYMLLFVAIIILALVWIRVMEGAINKVPCSPDNAGWLFIGSIVGLMVAIMGIIILFVKMTA